jgi:cytoskeletal protein RodZ
MARKKKLNEDQPQENINDSSDDTFGLPEIEYEPLKREEEKPEPEPEPVSSYTETTETVETTTTEEIRTDTAREQPREEIFQGEEERYIPYEEEESSSVWPKILGIAALLLIIAAGVWNFVKYRPEQLAKENKAKQEQAARDADVQRKQAEEAAARLREENEKRRADSLAAAVPPTGSIETLTERTGRYYVIVASAVDGDLIMDYAKKLSPKGVSSKIIPPNGKVKFFRLAVAEGDTYASTQSTADQLKAEYTEGAWVIKF